jgi:hypothetical protein
MIEKFKIVKSGVVITGVVLMFLVAANSAAAQPKDLMLSNSGMILTLLEDAAIEADADDSGACILVATLGSLDELSECGSDSSCRATAIFSMAIEILLCANPGDENIVFFACLSDVVMEMLDVSSVCDGDQTCVIQNMLPLALEIINCNAE